jgi:hypothetical protein
MGEVMTLESLESKSRVSRRGLINGEAFEEANEDKEDIESYRLKVGEAGT